MYLSQFLYSRHLERISQIRGTIKVDILLLLFEQPLKIPLFGKVQVKIGRKGSRGSEDK